MKKQWWHNKVAGNMADMEELLAGLAPAHEMLAMLMFMRKGLPFIYQGQEIGMENNVFHSIDEINDINTIDEYQLALQVGISGTDPFEKK